MFAKLFRHKKQKRDPVAAFTQLLQSKRRVAIIQITSHKSNTTTVRTAIKRCVGLQESL